MTRTANENVIVEPSKSHPGSWYWKVVTDEGETYAEGEGDDSYDFAIHTALGYLKEYRDKQEGIE